jgi:hypothetical protein
MPQLSKSNRSRTLSGAAVGIPGPGPPPTSSVPPARHHKHLINGVPPSICRWNSQDSCELPSNRSRISGIKIRNKMNYAGSIFHRVIPTYDPLVLYSMYTGHLTRHAQFMLQGGDFERHNRTGGYSIYGRKFPDSHSTVWISS